MLSARDIQNFLSSAKFINGFGNPATVPNISSASICCSRLVLARSASLAIRSYVSAKIVFLKIDPGDGGCPLGRYNLPDPVPPC